MLRRIPGRWRGSSVLKGYDAAQICVKGHIVSMFATTNPEKNREAVSMG
jgi:hypothetical protein